MAINGVLAMKHCATGIEIDTLCQDVASSKAQELTAVNLKINLKQQGLQVSFNERRNTHTGEAVAAGEDSLTSEREEGGADDKIFEAVRAKRSERMLELRQKLAAVFPEPECRVPVFTDDSSLLVTEKNSVSLVSGDEGAGVGGGAAWKRYERMAQLQQQIGNIFSDHSLPGTPALSLSDDAASETESLQDFPLSLQQQEPLVDKTFIAVLPYSVDEFNADLQAKYKHAVSVTADVSVGNVTINTVNKTTHRDSGIEIDTTVTGLSSSRARDLTAKNLNRNFQVEGLQWYRSARLD